jgi:hypothetical protein
MTLGEARRSCGRLQAFPIGELGPPEAGRTIEGRDQAGSMISCKPGERGPITKLLTAEPVIDLEGDNNSEQLFRAGG